MHQYRRVGMNMMNVEVGRSRTGDSSRLDSDVVSHVGQSGTTDCFTVETNGLEINAGLVRIPTSVQTWEPAPVSDNHFCGELRPRANMFVIDVIDLSSLL